MGRCRFSASPRDTGLMGGEQLSSPSQLSADSRLQVSWEDGDRLFCRRLRPDADGNCTAVLAVILPAEHPSPAALDRLAHEYSLKDELNEAWAVRPLELRRAARAVRRRDRPAGGDRCRLASLWNSGDFCASPSVSVWAWASCISAV
jgi:hypothetical protein